MSTFASARTSTRFFLKSAPPKAKRARADERTGLVGPDHVPTREEALAVLAGTPAPYRAAVALGLAGLRVGEVLGMTADRVELDRRRVTVDRQMQRYRGRSKLTTPKAEKVRTVVVPGLVAVELRRHLREHQADGILLRGLRGAEVLRRDQFYVSAWQPALKAAGLAEDRFKFHALRQLVRFDAARRGRADHSGRRTPGRHGRDSDTDVRALAPGQSGRTRGGARPAACATGRATGA